MHFLASCLEWVLPTASLFGARTFLVGLHRRDRLVDPTRLTAYPSVGKLHQMVRGVDGCDFGRFSTPKTQHRDGTRRDLWTPIPTDVGFEGGANEAADWHDVRDNGNGLTSILLGDLAQTGQHPGVEFGK